jgi:hypothetical protein
VSLPEAVRLGAWLGGAAAAAVIVREDRRSRRVPNAALAALGALTLTGWAALLLHSAFSTPGTSLPWAWHRGLGAHAAAAAAAGLGLWRAGVWPAGDAKLFILLAWLLPLAEPGLAPGGARLAVALLLNVFLPAAAVFLAAGLAWVWHTRLRHDAGFLRELGWAYVRDYARARQARLSADAAAAARGFYRGVVDEPARAAAGVLDALALAAAGVSALSALPGARGPWAALGFFLAWDVAGRLVGRRVLWPLSAAAAWWASGRAADPAALAGQAGLWLAFAAAMAAGRAAAAAFMGAEERLLPAAWLFGPLLGLAPFVLSQRGGWAAWAWWGAAGGAAWWFVNAFMEEDCFRLPPERFAAGLVPAAATLGLAQGDADFWARHFARRYPDGLTARQARALRGWARRDGHAELSFKTTRPFALWIFLGGALTALLGRDLPGAAWGAR